MRVSKDKKKKKIIKEIPLQGKKKNGTIIQRVKRQHRLSENTATGASDKGLVFILCFELTSLE